MEAVPKHWLINVLSKCKSMSMSLRMDRWTGKWHVCTKTERRKIKKKQKQKYICMFHFSIYISLREPANTVDLPIRSLKG